MARPLTTRQRLAYLEGFIPPQRNGPTIRDLPQAEMIATLLGDLLALAGADDPRSRALRGLYAVQLHALLPSRHPRTPEATAAIAAHAERLAHDLGTRLAPGWTDAVG